MARTVLHFDKYASEDIAQTVDFVDVLEGGESISSRSVTAVDESGAAAAGIIASVGGTGSQVTYRVSGGTPGEFYYIDVEVTLNTTEVHVQRLKMQVPRP